MPKKIPIEKVLLIYHCEECSLTIPQPLAELNEVGTLICSDCDKDMLVTEVLIND